MNIILNYNMVERRIKLKVDKGFQDFKDFLREKINEELQSITTYLTEGELTIDILNNMVMAKSKAHSQTCQARRF